MTNVKAVLACVSLGVLCPSQIVSQSPRLIPDATCSKVCAIAVRRVLQLGVDDDTAVVTSPLQIVQDSRGNLIVAWDLGGNPGPPSVFDATGHLIARVGRRGAGPGEMTRTHALTIGPRDSVRVYDPTRLIDFGPDWKHVRTTSRDPGFMLQGNVVPFLDGSFVATGMEPVYRGEPRPIHFQSAKGGSRSLEGKLLTPPEAGRSRALAATFTRGQTGHFWIAQFERNQGRGYDLYLADTTGRIQTAARRRPAWWRSGTTGTTRSHVAVSRVLATREIRPGILATLIAQPLANWRDIPFNKQTFAGVWNLYEGILEVVDVGRGVVVGRARFPGYPRALLTDERFAVYRELDDGRPLVEVFHFSVPRPN